MIRALTEKLPIMITPRWVSVPAQPIGVEDLIAFLTRAIDKDLAGDPIYQVGGPDVVSYGGLMKAYATARGLRRWMIPVPVLTPRLSSLWLGLFTPLYKRIGQRLIASLRNPTIVTDDSARLVFGVETQGVANAIASALKREDEEFESTNWSDAVSSTNVRRDWAGIRLGNRIVDSRQVLTSAAASDAFAVVESVGAKNGWFFATWLWRVRGILDIIFGGVGMNRGRRHPSKLRTGDVVDCWRVAEVAPGRLLRFSAEMKLPGRAWLEFEIDRDGEATRIRQTATFDPLGLGGLAYWYGLYPIHKVIFAGMLRSIARRANAGMAVQRAEDSSRYSASRSA